ncbi:MAG: SusC/RagA family TonB-linked outer membrane protein [Massilibacteroides sp.]|nr:SusC/RagA family TonB-linked outer membrane protein [Massilibacteroides sp.]MDD3062905.1 SusC/RagA family TonB-linked outer membrane protein [Massilibacteroides sp.]MDD4115875.1 SusC/RagA family TonB-linked outer membrane protein [Massilibacteroides sp.]MDD4660458.1 SusC/RagA family TonB-linked outer membrane protein [Massilibacteroides sp.]
MERKCLSFMLSFLVLFVCTFVAHAQVNVTGIVKDSNGEPLIGVNVIVKNAQQGTVTNLDGEFSLDVSSTNTVLEFSYVGYKMQEIPLGGKTYVSVILAEDTEVLDEVVVTALGIKREKKALGYAMQEIKTDAISEIKSPSVANLLQGKVAGVQISQSGAGLGSSTRIVLRGLNSLSGKNQPLWVVDGIPISDGQAEEAGQWGGLDYSGAAADINPDDIETISVLKGANAAALYGSRAQSGAIVITTKKGSTSQPLQIEYSGNLSLSDVYNSYDYQNKFSQGSNGVYNADATSSWGELMDGSRTVQNWRSTKYGETGYSDYTLLPQKDYIEDFYRTGVSYNNSLVASGGSENLSARLSFTDSRNDGVTPNHSINRQYYDLNTQFNNKYLTIGAKINFMRQKANNRPGQGEYGIMQSLVRMPRGIRLQDLKDPVGSDGYVQNWSGPSNEYLNPYALTMPENGNNDERNRIIGQVYATAHITDYLSLTGRAGMDWYNDLVKNYTTYIQKSSTASQYYHTQRTNQEFNADVMLNFNKGFGDFSVTANLGAATMNVKYNGLTGSSGLLNLPGLLTLGNGLNQTVSESYSKKEVHSVLGNAQIGYKGMAYLDVTGRNDWSSTLPSNNWSYFYPSVSLSAIITEMVSLPSQISYLKLRGSWAQVGNDTNPYNLTNPYVMGLTIGNVLSAYTSGTYPLSNLKPEETKSWEVGLDMRMFQGRFGIDFTYYKSNTTNQILSVGMPASSGYTSKRINAGRIQSSGAELMISGTPIQTKDWQWDVNVNWGTNTSKCISLDGSIKRFTLGSTRIGSVVVDEGGKFGDIVSIGYKRDDQGRMLIDDNGFPIKESDKTIGNILPDWTGSVSSTLRYKNLSFYMLVDIREGGDFISMTDNYAKQTGTSAKTLEGRDGMVVDGIVSSTGAQNTTEIMAENYYTNIAGPNGVGEAFLYKSSYIKMREMSLGYIFPSAWLRNLPIKSVKLSVVGRDLFFFQKDAPVNPESALTRSDYAQAFEYSSMPPTRSFGFTLNVKF